MRMWTRVALLCAMMLGGAFLMSRGSGPAVVPPRESLSSLPYAIGGWQGQEAGPMSDAAKEMLRLTDYTNRTYQNGRGGLVGLYIGYHSQGGFHSPLNCMPGSGWNIMKKSFEEIAVQKGLIEVNRVVLMKGIDKQVVLYWYQGCGRAVASEYRGLLYGMWDKMRSGRTDAALVRVISPARNLEPEAEEDAATHAIEFVQLVYPMLSRFIPE